MVEHPNAGIHENLCKSMVKRIVQKRFKSKKIVTVSEIFWVVDKLFPGSREELQGDFWEGFDLLFEQFSVYFPVGFSVNNPYTSM